MDRRGLLFALALTICQALAERPALAQDAAAQEPPEVSEATKACLDAFTVGQQLRRQGKLRASRAKLTTCAQPQCPGPISEKCVRWVGELVEAIPTVVVVARDARKRDLTNVRVLVDGKLLTTRLDGRALEVDPGSRRFRFLRAGVAPVEHQLVIVEREKGRRLEVVLAAPARKVEPPREEERPISPVVWAGLGIGAANLVVGAVSAALAAERFSDLESACTTRWQGNTYCLESQRGLYDEGRVLADLSTATFVVGGASIAIGMVALIVSLTGPPQQPVGLGPSGIEGRF